MAYSIFIKENAFYLRKRGYSIDEIHKELKVSKGRISEWVRNIKMSKVAKSRFLEKIKLARISAADNRKKKTQNIINSIFDNADEEIKKISYDIKTIKIFCSLIYWCEGVKDLYSIVNFTNSDPGIVKTFLALLRKSFEIDERKFRVCIHLHSYHNPKKQLEFWSNITEIPLKQFIKPFFKVNSGRRIRKDYNGCVSIRYHDVIIGRQLLMTAKAFLLKYSKVENL